MITAKRALAAILVLLVVGGAVAATQSVTVRNAFYAFSYERTLDRYDQLDTTTTAITSTVGANGEPAKLLSAFYGVDDALPFVANRVICEGSSGKDGMPIIFSSEIDISTLEPGDIRVTRSSGRVGDVTCLTMAPADSLGELRTALLAGQFGSVDDPPETVEIIGHVLSIDGSHTFKGTKVDVTPLEDGPSIVWAEVVPENEWTIGARATGIPFGGGSGCPDGTKQVVRVTWGGGVTRTDGSPAGDQERKLYEVVVDRDAQGEAIETPSALADLGDGDNNHKLCLSTNDTVKSVSFPAGYLTDPRDDLNPATAFQIVN